MAATTSMKDPFNLHQRWRSALINSPSKSHRDPTTICRQPTFIPRLSLFLSISFSALCATMLEREREKLSERWSIFSWKQRSFHRKRWNYQGPDQMLLYRRQGCVKRALIEIPPHSSTLPTISRVYKRLCVPGWWGEWLFPSQFIPLTSPYCRGMQDTSCKKKTNQHQVSDRFQ